MNGRSQQESGLTSMGRGTETNDSPFLVSRIAPPPTAEGLCATTLGEAGDGVQSMGTRV